MSPGAAHRPRRSLPASLSAQTAMRGDGKADRTSLVLRSMLGPGVGSPDLVAPTPVGRRWSALLCSLAVLLLAGCSALSLAYRNAPALGTLWIDRALDLPAAHRALLGEAAVEVYHWHRGVPARELAAILREAARRLAGPVGDGDVEWLTAALQDHVRQVGERLALELGPRLLPFTGPELGRIERRMRERREEYAEEIAAGRPERQRELRIERIEEALEDWLGSVTPAQHELIAGSESVSRYDARLWIEEQARRERELLAALAADDRGASLQAWFHDWRSGRPAAVADALQRQRSASIAMWVALLNLASDEQRRHLRTRLEAWAKVFAPQHE